MKKGRVEIPDHELSEFCRRWQITELALFGSALTDNFRPDSDLDLLVSFSPAAEWSLLDHVQMQRELEAITGRDVDLVSKRAIERSENWIRRDAILSSAESVY